MTWVTPFVMVIDHNREVKERIIDRARDHEILELGSVERYLSPDHVIEGDALAFVAQTHDLHCARSVVFCRLFGYIGEIAGDQLLQTLSVAFYMLRLTVRTIGFKTEPFELMEDIGFILRFVACSIGVFDAYKCIRRSFCARRGN